MITDQTQLSLSHSLSAEQSDLQTANQQSISPPHAAIGTEDRAVNSDYRYQTRELDSGDQIRGILNQGYQIRCVSGIRLVISN